MHIQLENITWNITQVDEIKVSDLKPNKVPSFTLNSDSHRISGNSGCNQFGGGYTFENNVLTTSKMFSTEMACIGLMELEQKINTAFNQPLTLKTEGSQTMLTSADGKTVMKISAQVAGN
nr:META domain-containing protein [Bacteroidota bacterium]